MQYIQFIANVSSIFLDRTKSVHKRMQSLAGNDQSDLPTYAEACNDLKPSYNSNVTGNSIMDMASPSAPSAESVRRLNSPNRGNLNGRNSPVTIPVSIEIDHKMVGTK